jgi:TPR repeat protein
MNPSGVVVVDRAEQIKWWDVVDALTARWGTVREEVAGTAEVLRLARNCLHPDAQWLTSVIPSGAGATRHFMAEMLLEQGRGDPRAAFVASCAKGAGYMGLLRFAAENGYAPAQARLSAWADLAQEKFLWAQRAYSQGDRCGIARMADCFRLGLGCWVNKERAIELYKEAAPLLDPSALYYYGLLGFGELDAERYQGWALASTRGFGEACRVGITVLLPSFENGENGRTLQLAGPLLKANPKLLNIDHSLLRYRSETEQALRVVEMYEMVLGFANRRLRAGASWGAGSESSMTFAS